MLPFLLLIPAAYFIWKHAHRHERRWEHLRAGYLPPSRHRREPARGRGSSTSEYLRHVHEATMAARVLDMAKPYALSNDVQGLMSLPDDVVRALAVLAAPLDVLFAQKDLNVLGATPSLPEDGVLDAATVSAIQGIQSRFGQNTTGELNDGTCVAIRYAVGCINGQGI